MNQSTEVKRKFLFTSWHHCPALECMHRLCLFLLVIIRLTCNLPFKTFKTATHDTIGETTDHRKTHEHVNNSVRYKLNLGTEG
jgi:hypothetical protein